MAFLSTPKVFVAQFYMGIKKMTIGTFCISLDVEADFGRKREIIGEDQVVQKLIFLLNKYQLRATFAVVGKMFDQNPRLIKLIQNSDNEIGYHSLTHPDFSRLSKSEAEAEVENKQHFKSFVFPFNKIHHLQRLKKNHFTCFRGNPFPYFPNILGFIFPLSYQPKKQVGLVNIPGSMYFPSNRKLGQFIPQGARLFQAKKGLDDAIKTGRVFHLWTHPVDLINSKILKEFEAILKYAGDIKKQSKINNLTMAEIALAGV